MMPKTERERGATMVFVALALPVLIVMTAFAVDLGRQRSSRRTMQARADVIALDMVRLIDGRDSLQIYSDPATEAALLASAARNGIDRSKITEVVWGEYDPTILPLNFQPHHQPGFAPAAGLIPDAVLITASEPTDYFFQPGSGSATRSAVATSGPEVGVTVGSVAAGVQLTLPSGGVTATATVAALNARLSAAFGASVPSPGSVGLDAASYEGLAATDVDIWRIAQAGGFGSPNELLAEELTVGEFLDFTASALDQQAAEGDPNAAGAAIAVRELGSEIGSSVGLESAGTIMLGDTIQFAQGGDDAAATGTVNVLDLLSGGADVINGKHFVSYAFNPGVPGVAQVNVQQYVVQPSQTSFGGLGTFAENKQTAFQITLDVAPLIGMSSPVVVPLVVQAATATGTVDAIRCTEPAAPNEVDIDVDTSVLSTNVGTATNFASGGFAASVGVIAESDQLTLVAILQLGLSMILGADLKAEASATLLGANDQILTFQPDVEPVPFQRAQGGIGATNLGAQLSNSLKVKYGPAGSVFNANLASQLGYVFDNLDQQILGPLMTATGVAIGGADVKAHDLNCGAPKLVG